VGDRKKVEDEEIKRQEDALKKATDEAEAEAKAKKL